MRLLKFFNNSTKHVYKNQLRLFSASKFNEYRASDDKIVSVDLLPDSKNVYVLSLNRPEAKNALSSNLVAALIDKINHLRDAQECQVLIVRSLVDGAFCAGADLKERLNMPPIKIGPFVDKLRRMTIKINDLPCPTIAAVDGVALGGGFEVALACDLIVTSSKAKLGLVETKLGIIPGAGGTQRLPRLIGSSRAKDLIFTGRILNGKEAYDWGIANYYSEESAFEKAKQLANDISNCGPIALQAAKFAINKGIEVDIGSGFAFEKASYSTIVNTEDRIEGLKAFVEKRKPRYKGK